MSGCLQAQNGSAVLRVEDSQRRQHQGLQGTKFCRNSPDGLHLWLWGIWQSRGELLAQLSGLSAVHYLPAEQ